MKCIIIASMMLILSVFPTADIHTDNLSDRDLVVQRLIAEYVKKIDSRFEECKNITVEIISEDNLSKLY